MQSSGIKTCIVFCDIGQPVNNANPFKIVHAISPSVVFDPPHPTSICPGRSSLGGGSGRRLLKFSRWWEIENDGWPCGIVLGCARGGVHEQCHLICRRAIALMEMPSDHHRHATVLDRSQQVLTTYPGVTRGPIHMSRRWAVDQ